MITFRLSFFLSSGLSLESMRPYPSRLNLTI
jgi:hypothetical protein